MDSRGELQGSEPVAERLERGWSCPLQLERLIDFGFCLLVDVFLSVLTMAPLRATRAVFTVLYAFASGRCEIQPVEAQTFASMTASISPLPYWLLLVDSQAVEFSLHHRIVSYRGERAANRTGDGVQN
jgi:hypothetical protein